jgi:p-aminobenzoyl-glutamate transporter AbgT
MVGSTLGAMIFAHLERHMFAGDLVCFEGVHGI